MALARVVESCKQIYLLDQNIPEHGMKLVFKTRRACYCTNTRCARGTARARAVQVTSQHVLYGPRTVYANVRTTVRGVRLNSASRARVRRRCGACRILASSVRHLIRRKEFSLYRVAWWREFEREI